MQTAENLLIEALKEIEISLSEQMLQQLFQFMQLMLAVNQTTNLTAITDYQEALIKHIYDALLIMKLPAFQAASKLLDVGSGGGVPAIPLAIVAPDKEVYSLDATQKKIKFQAEAAEKLGLANFKPIWGRAEELAHQAEYREQYPLVTARAVAACNVLTELTFGFVKLKGTAVFYKGTDQGELNQAKIAIRELGGELIEVSEFSLPQNYGSRMLIQIKKIKPTSSKYPRKAGIPNKKPL